MSRRQSPNSLDDRAVNPSDTRGQIGSERKEMTGGRGVLTIQGVLAKTIRFRAGQMVRTQQFRGLEKV